MTPKMPGYIMRKHIDIKRELSGLGKVLDIGCGVHPLGTVNLDIDIANKGADIFADPQAGLPFKSQSFQAVVLSDVLEHVENPLHVLTESIRVLKKKGKLIVSIPNSGHILFRLGIWSQNPLTGNKHINFWTRHSFLNFCRDLDIELEKFKPTYYFKGNNIIYKLMPNLAPCLMFIFRKK